MTCFCLCHNGYAVENGQAPDHAPEQCPCAHAGDQTTRARVEITQAVDEQLLQKQALEDAMRKIIERAEANDTIAQLVEIARAALEPTVLCATCRQLTTSFPCVRCGASHT